MPIRIPFTGPNPGWRIAGAQAERPGGTPVHDGPLTAAVSAGSGSGHAARAPGGKGFDPLEMGRYTARSRR
jgi:hypothetical protein